MNPIVALVFHFCVSLMSCRSIKYIELDPNKDIFDEHSSPTETDNQKIFSNQLRFLKVLPLNKEWKNTIDGPTLETETKKQKSVPFAIIVTTADDDLEQFKNSALKSTYVEDEELKTVDEKPKDNSNIQIEVEEKDHESKLINDNKSGMTLKNIEEQIREVLHRMNTKSNTGEVDHSEINNDLILRKPQIKDKINFENQLENIIIQDNDAEMRELLTDISKAKLGNEETLHNKEETEREHALLEVNNDPEDATALNPVFCEYSKQSDSCNERYINVNEDDFNSYPISLVLNKYVFVN